MEVNWTYCGDHFAIYTSIKSCCTPETNIMLYVNYPLQKKDTQKRIKYINR